jgi:PqqD family protein of HPr-rel-A system
MAQPDVLWVVSDPESILHRHWDGEDETVLFVQTSGELHLVSADAGRLVSELRRRPATADELAALTEQRTHAIDRALAALQAIGLVMTLQ